MENHLPLITALLLVGCGTSHFIRGLDAYNSNKNAEAARHWQACAAEGEPPCMYNIGVMYQNRRIQSANHVTDAIRWYSLAARHGHSAARVALVELGAAVPAADLERAPREATPEEIEAARALGALIGTAIGGRRR